MFEITPEQEQELLNRLNMMAQSGSSKADIQAYNQQYRRENGREKKSPVVKESEIGTPETPPSPSPSPSKSTFGGSTKSAFSDPFAFLNKQEEETLLPVQKKKAATAVPTVATNLNDPKDFQEKMFGVNKFGNKTLRIDRGLQEPQELEIDPRTIPYSPYTNVTDDVFLGTVRFKLINNQPLNKQEEAFLDKNKRTMSTFGIDDENELGLLSKANGLDMTAISGVRIPDMIGNQFPQVKGKTFGEVANTAEGTYAQIQAVKLKLKSDLEKAQNVTTGATGQMKDEQKIASLKEQIDELDLLETKAIKGLTKISNQTAQGTIRTDNTGNNFNRFVGVLQDAAESGINIVLKTVMPAVGALMPKDSKPEVDKDVELRVEQLPSQAFTGLSFLKYKEPVEFARVTRLIAEGKPISETQIANLTNIGIEIEKEKLKEDYNLQVIDKTTYDKNNLELSQKSYNNLVGNKEVLRSFLSSNIADVLDEIEKTKIQNNVAGTREFGEVFGMRWQYTDEEIDYAAKVVAKANGLNADDPRVKEAIKYLQDNEGAMIMQNSISKSGFARDFFKGAAMPIRGIVATVEGVGKTSEEKYAEAQSQGNVNVSEAPVKRIANSWEGTAAKVFEGAGQLVSQAGLAYLTGGAIGGVGGAILGRGGAALGTDVAVADVSASNIAGAGLSKGKDFLSTFVTTFASTYDSNLKQAQTYTADDGKAMAVAGGLSGIEALAENALSPLDIARGVGKTLFGKTSTQKIINILDDAKILDKKSVIQEYLTGTLKAGLASGRMVATEIGEEEITALADYGTNMILNPNSQSFKNRVLKEELFETGIETGLSMVIPALLTGVGAFDTNSFAKGSLIIAAQNRQMIVDALDKNLADGLVTQDEYNKKLQIVNSASKANQELPLKADGSKLNSEEKANYIYSRVSEGALERKIEVSTDEAEKTILRSKIAEQQKSRETILNTPTNVQTQTTQNVSTQAQNNQGQQGQDNQTQNATTTQNAPIVEEPTEAQILDDIKNKRFATFTYDKEEDVPEVFKDKISSRGETNGVPFVRVTLPQSRADYELSKVAPKKEAEVVIDEEAVAVLEGLTPTEKLSDFEITMLKGSPKLAYEMIADQALGFGRVNGVRQPIPEAAAGTNEASVREKYGDAVVDKALQLYPLQTTKTNDNENQKSNTEGVLGGVREEGNKNEGGQGGQQLYQGKEEMTVAQLRAEEQKELAAAIPNIESYKVDGKVDKTLITDEAELATYNEIFDRYDKLITPKLEEEKAAVAANPALKDVESTTKALDADKIKKIEELADIDADPANLNEGTTSAQYVANLYHLSKADDSNPELVSAVESVLSKEQTQSTLKTEQDAIQKQTAGEVPVQSRATVGETMEEGIPQAEPQSVAQEGETKKEAEQQIEDFGVAKKDVGAVYNVISKVFDSLKNAGLTAVKNVGEWVGIGKGAEMTSSLKKGESEKDFGGFRTRDGKPIGYTYDTDKVARERFDISKLKKIGSGSDRDVYDLGDGRVLKIAKTARGLTQNIYEGDYYLKGIIPEVTERGLNYVVAENTPRIKTSDVVEIFDEDGNAIGTATAGQMLKELQQFSQKDFDNRVGKLQDVLYKYGFYDIMNYDVLWGDFIVQRNWGYKDGKAYHSDGGTFGGVDMITSYRGKTNMSDPEFRKIYEESKRLKKEFGDTDKATMYKEEEGKVQAQFRIESGKNVVEAIEEFNGSPRAVVALTHEIMHPTVVAIVDGAKDGNEVGTRHTQTIVDEFNKANPDNTITTEELIAGNEEFKQGTTNKKYRDVQEFIAENWEKYHTEGAKGFSKAFQEVLEQISKAFQAVYSTLKGEQVTPELRQMFDEILRKEQTTNNGATATATNQPVSTTEGTTQQQGGQEAVQQGATDAGQAGARTAPTIRPTVKRLATDGTELVTLSGLTEEERQDKIAERKKKTGVSERVIEEQALLDDIKAYEALMNGNRGKTSPQGLAQLNRLRNRIAEYNRKYNSKYRYDDRRGVLRGNTGKTVKRVAIDSEKAIVDGQVLSDRSPKTQKIFQELFSASAMPTAYMANGIRMSAAQLDGVIDDIVDGIPSRRATNYLNSLENQIEQDDFDFSKSGSESQESRPKTPLSFVLGTEFEFVGEPMTQEALESWLADEADFDPEFEEIVTDNIDNLITDYEQEGTPTENEEPIPAAEAKDSGKPKQDSKEGGESKGDKPKPSPKPKPSEPDGKETDAVKKARDKKIEDFNNKVDANAKALIDFLTPKGMEGVKKSGLGVAEIVNNASKIIKAAYAASQNIKDAVQKGLDYFIANWDETELGELPVEALRAKLEADLSDANDGVGITHAATASTLNEFALPEYKKEAETFAKWDAEAAERIKNGEMPALIEKLKNYSEASPVEVRMLGMYIANLKEVASRTKSDEDIAKMYEAIKLSDSLGSKEGKSLVARKGLFMNGDTLADYFQEEMDAIGVDVLTEEQKSEIEKEYEAIKQAKDEWEKERERLNRKILEFEAQAEVNRQAKEAAKKGKSTKTTEDFSIERQKIVGDIREKLKKARSGTNATIVPYANELFAIAPDVAKLVKSLVEQGVVTLTDLVSEVKANLIGEIPQITDSDVRDLISGAYNEKKQTKSQLAKEIFDLKEEARLTNKWAALQAGELPKTEKGKIERNKQIKELREKIEKFRRDNPTDKESLDAIKKSYETRIKKLEDDLRTGNFLQNPVVKPPVKLDKEAIDAKDKLIKLKNERKLRILRAEYSNRSRYQKGADAVANITNIPRALMTTLDFSGVLRQGLIPTVSGLLSSNPRKIINTIGQMFRSAVSQKEYDRWFADLEESSNYELMIDSGLALTDNNNPSLTVREEAFMSSLVSKIPFFGREVALGKDGVRVPFTDKTLKSVGGFVKGSERSYTAYMNKLRVDMFNSFASAMQERGVTFDNNEEAYKQMAKYVNNATGRGGLPKVAGGDLNTISPLLNGLFFSPRLISSRLNMLTYFAQKRFYDKVPKEVRVAYFSDMAKFIGLGVGVLFLASLSGGGDDEEEKVTVELDPRSSDFAKIRSGDTRWDIWGGFQPYVRLVAQVSSGKRKSTSSGAIIEMDGEGMFNGTKGEQIISFTRGKLSPVPAIAVDLFSGRTAAGDKIIFDIDPKERSSQITVGKYAIQHLLPLTITGTAEALKEDGYSSLLTVGLPNIFGIGTQKYGDTEIKILDDLPKVGEKGLQRLEEKGIKKLDDLRKYKGKLKTLKYKDDDGKERRIFTNPQIKSIDSIFSIKPKVKN
jgi:hypothetical protein